MYVASMIKINTFISFMFLFQNTMTTAELSVGQLEDPAEPAGEGRSGDGATTRKPKRVLHFSDGVVEEYSSEEETAEVKEQVRLI